MLSSKRMLKIGLVLLGLTGMTALGACQFAPVYSGALAEQPNIGLAYAPPGNRLAQIINQELMLRLGVSDAATAPLATITAYARVQSRTLSKTADPFKAYEVTVTAIVVVTPPEGLDAEPYKIERQATAGFTSNPQVQAQTEAKIDAEERAAKSAAAALRLAILARHAR